jgi:UrcA family protein
MNIGSSRSLIALIALAGTCTLAATANAGNLSIINADVPSVAVNYSDIDASSSDGARQLYVRLKAAARLVCAPMDGSSLAQKGSFTRCYNTALEAAVTKVDHETLSALHLQAHRDSAS